MPKAWAKVEEEMRKSRARRRKILQNKLDPAGKWKRTYAYYKRWIKKNTKREDRLASYLEYARIREERKKKWEEENPDQAQRYYDTKKKVESEQEKRKRRRKLNLTNPDKGYEKTLLEIAALPDREERWDANFDMKELKTNMRREIRNQKARDAYRLAKMTRWKNEAEELGITLDALIIQRQEADRQRKLKREKEAKDKEAEQRMREFFTPEQILINERLRQLQKKTPTYQYDPDKKEKQKQYIKEEIKKKMAKISFDKGKTMYDLTEDRDFNIVLTKVSKKKTWDMVVDHFDSETMMKALDSMSASDKKLAINGSSGQSRILYLSRYLMNATEDLIM